MFYFKQKEFKCKCGKCSPIHGEDWVDTELIVKLEVLREWAGVPLYVNSGYRCPAHNKAIGGSPRSQHKTGKAADIRYPKGVDKVAFVDKALEIFDRGGVGVYPTFVHMDVRGYKARWGKR